MPIEEARRNEEVISLASSQVLRWIDELNGVIDADSKAREIKSEIRRIRHEPVSLANRRAIKKLYAQLDNLQFKPDYMCLIIDRDKDYLRACKGFSINGVTYTRLLGTNGGIKNSTIVFVSERLAPELRRRIDNGRNLEQKLVPAKFEAYKALACSASTPVSMPNGILVVPDVITKFTDHTIYLNDENDGEPEISENFNTDIELNASDGFGLMLPSLAERWSEDLELGYVSCGFNTRMSFSKGMVFTFDFISFARDVAENYIVKDAWGNEVDVRDVELVLTTSMLKLWDSYDSCEDYLENCEANGYTFNITKCCPEKLEDERNLNYQFIQSYDLDDDDIEDLISPTIQEIREILGGDWRKTILYLAGAGLDERKALRLEDNIAKAIMADRRMLKDPYVSSAIYNLIKNRINEAKVGVIKVHGNYSIVSGDPYALCQNIFGLEVTGLLKAGEIYNKYWIDCDAEKLVCFRAPMSTHENIRTVYPSYNAAAEYWYKYMNACTIFNAWDTSTAALNGMDFDGDLVMLTDNPVLVSKHKELPTIMCVQRKAEKKVPTEEDIIQSNLDSAGNDIGAVTNRVTSMFEVKSHYEVGSLEYEELEYRIKCGQLIQQNTIDKSKGIIAKPMPATWYERRAVNAMEDADAKSFYRSIVADRKPYFMRYIYPDLMKQYREFIKKTERNCLREFEISVDELKRVNTLDLTQQQKDFIYYYDLNMPVGIGDCVMNKICRRFEQEFDGFVGKESADSDFDYQIMKSGCEYSPTQLNAIKRLYQNYNSELQNIIIGNSRRSRTDIDELNESFAELRKRFVAECCAVCSNEEVLCEILLDICYQRSNTKKFVWDICRKQIINNLVHRNNGVIQVPIKDESGSLVYCGNHFKMYEVAIGEDE